MAVALTPVFRFLWETLEFGVEVIRALTGSGGFGALIAARDQLMDAWEGVAAFFEDLWQRIESAFNMDFLERVAGVVGAIFGGGGAPTGTAQAAAPGAPALVAPESPSLFAPTAPATPGAGGSPADRANRARGASSRVTVDFRNLPRGARVSTEAPADADLEVNAGYALMTAG